MVFLSLLFCQYLLKNQACHTLDTFVHCSDRNFFSISRHYVGQPGIFCGYAICPAFGDYLPRSLKKADKAIIGHNKKSIRNALLEFDATRFRLVAFGYISFCRMRFCESLMKI
jgi:hypothetical protein